MNKLSKFLIVFLTLGLTLGTVSAQEYSMDDHEYFGFAGNDYDEVEFLYYQEDEQMDSFDYLEVLEEEYGETSYVEVSEPQTLIKDREEKIVQTGIELMDFDEVVCVDGAQCYQKITWTVDEYGNIEIIEIEDWQDVDNIEMFSDRSLRSVHYLPDQLSDDTVIGADIRTDNIFEVSGQEVVNEYGFNVDIGWNQGAIFDIDNKLISAVDRDSDNDNYEIRDFDNNLVSEGEREDVEYVWKDGETYLYIDSENNYEVVEDGETLEQGTMDGFGNQVTYQNGEFIDSTGSVFSFDGLNIELEKEIEGGGVPMSYNGDFIVLQNNWAGDGSFTVYDPENNVEGVDEYEYFDNIDSDEYFDRSSNIGFAMNLFDGVNQIDSFSSSTELESLVQFSSGTEVVNDSITIKEGEDTAVSTISTEATQVTLDVTVEGDSKLESDDLLQNGEPMDIGTSGEYTLESPESSSKLRFTRNSDVSVNSVTYQGEEQSSIIDNYVPGQTAEFTLSVESEAQPDQQYSDGTMTEYYVKAVAIEGDIEDESVEDYVVIGDEESDWQQINFSDSDGSETVQIEQSHEFSIERYTGNEYSAALSLVEVQGTNDDLSGEWDLETNEIERDSYSWTVTEATAPTSPLDTLFNFFSSILETLTGTLQDEITNSPIGTPSVDSTPTGPE